MGEGSNTDPCGLPWGRPVSGEKGLWGWGLEQPNHPQLALRSYVSRAVPSTLSIRSVPPNGPSYGQLHNQFPHPSPGPRSSSWL